MALVLGLTVAAIGLALSLLRRAGVDEWQVLQSDHGRLAHAAALIEGAQPLMRIILPHPPNEADAFIPHRESACGVK